MFFHETYECIFEAVSEEIKKEIKNINHVFVNEIIFYSHKLSITINIGELENYIVLQLDIYEDLNYEVTLFDINNISLLVDDLNSKEEILWLHYRKANSFENLMEGLLKEISIAVYKYLEIERKESQLKNVIY